MTHNLELRALSTQPPTAEHPTPEPEYLLLIGPHTLLATLESYAAALAAQLGETAGHRTSVPASDGWRHKIRIELTGPLPKPVSELAKSIGL